MKRSLALSFALLLATPVAFAQSSGSTDAPKQKQAASQPAASSGEQSASGGASESPSPGGSSAGAESQSAKKPKTGDYYESNENKADPNLKAEKHKEKEEGVTN